MQLSLNEIRLLDKVTLKTGAWIHAVNRKSDKEYDISFEGHSPSGYAYMAWLPTYFIANMTDWGSPAIANMTDYPDMAKTWDWSAVRDTSDEKIWDIFHKHVPK